MLDNVDKFLMRSCHFFNLRIISFIKNYNIFRDCALIVLTKKVVTIFFKNYKITMKTLYTSMTSIYKIHSKL